MEISTKYHQIQKEELFQKGLKQFQEGTVPPIILPKIYWVKKFVSVKDYNQYYKYDGIYCFLKKVPLKGVWLGFLITDYIPKDCFKMTDEEMRQTDDYRKSYHIGPTPFKEVPIKDNKPKFQDTLIEKDKENYEGMFGEKDDKEETKDGEI